jgi:prolycopene isomerase
VVEREKNSVGAASRKTSVIVVGAGLSGLTAAALLAERGLAVTVIEQCDRPGGAASAFRRGDITYDTGAAMLFGFGERGFNPHRWLMDTLGEPIEMYRHEIMYRLFYGDDPIAFHADRKAFIAELARLFPEAEGEIAGFYDYIGDLYEKVIAPVAVFEAPGDMPLSEMRKNAANGLGAQLAMIRLLFTSAETMMKPYISDPQARAFFDKLTSTYCYTTIGETPAVLAATMFVDNHVGGAWYPAGSAMALSARLEKAIEARGGIFRYRTKMTRLLGSGGAADGVAVMTPEGEEELSADRVLYSGSLRGFAESLDPDGLIPGRWKRRILRMVMSMPSFVVYGAVERATLPKDATPVQMFVDNKQALDEGDVTLYLPSLEDPSLAPPELSTFLLIGPSLARWPSPSDPDYQGEDYRAAKKAEADRMLALVERRMPGFVAGMRGRVEASPTTIWRYLGKSLGSVAGPKQKMGQHLIFRQGARGPIPGLYFAGESTTMGTGTPAVTVSGISAANRILRALGLEPFSTARSGGLAVRRIPAGQRGNLPATDSGRLAARCRWCEAPRCVAACPCKLDVPGIMRRLEAGNLFGAVRAAASAASAASAVVEAATVQAASAAACGSAASAAEAAACGSVESAMQAAASVAAAGPAAATTASASAAAAKAGPSIAGAAIPCQACAAAAGGNPPCEAACILAASAGGSVRIRAAIAGAAAAGLAAAPSAEP